MYNALSLLEERTTRATAGAVSYTVLRCGATGATSPFQEHEDALNGLGNSGFKSAKVNKADIAYVEDLSVNTEKLAQLVANLFRIIRDGKTGAAVNYGIFMSTWMAVMASVLHWERKSEDEKDRKSAPWAKQLLMVAKGVMNQFTEMEIQEKLEAFEGSPVHNAMVAVWRKLWKFLKRLWLFVKSWFRHGAETVRAGEIDVEKLLGTCVSAMRTFHVLSRNVEGIGFTTNRIPGLPVVHTPVAPA